MNLYLISQDVNNNYDTYDSAVVAAKSHADARDIHPSTRYVKSGGGWQAMYNGKPFASPNERTSEWCSSAEVHVELIGTTDKYEAGTVICASFNAG